MLQADAPAAARVELHQRNGPQIAAEPTARTATVASEANYAGAGAMSTSLPVNAVADLAEERELVGNNIRLARKFAGEMSQETLAADLTQRLGSRISFREVSRWEHGRRLPNLRTMRAIGQALGRSRGWFYDEHPELEA